MHPFANGDSVEVRGPSLILTCLGHRYRLGAQENSFACRGGESLLRWMGRPGPHEEQERVPGRSPACMARLRGPAASHEDGEEFAYLLSSEVLSDLQQDSPGHSGDPDRGTPSK
jgi:hypothetical protein